MANNGNRGRFSDRIKKIRLSRFMRKRNDDVNYKRFLKVLSIVPLVVVGNIIDSSKKEDKKNDLDVKKKETVVSSENLESLNSDDLKASTEQKNEDSRREVENIDVSLIKKKQEELSRKPSIVEKNESKETDVTVDCSEKKYNGLLIPLGKNEKADRAFKYGRHFSKSPQELEKKIIDLLKTDLMKMLNELEIYESELYILSELNSDEKTLVQCREHLSEVRKVLDQVNEIKERYDFLRDNFDFEYLLETDSNELIDSIIELKNMFGNNDVRATVEDYKLLDVYKQLYLKVDEMHTKTYEIEEQKKKHEQELKDRDSNFEKLTKDVYNIGMANESYESFIKQQNRLLVDLSEKVSKIDSHESVTYHLKGYGRYLFNSFKYLGLLMANPFRTLIPSIVFHTAMAGAAVQESRKGLQWEENRRMVYEGVDYFGVINQAIHDLDVTSNMVDASLYDLVRLKSEYSSKYSRYEGDFYEYGDVMRKINKMQDAMIGHKMKIEMMKNRVLEQERANKNKMKLVRKLNDDAIKKAS